MKILTLPSNQGKWKDVCAGVILEGTYYGSDYEPPKISSSDAKSPPTISPPGYEPAGLYLNLVLKLNYFFLSC